MRGATQCYEFMPSQEPCVLSLSSDAPFGYRIDEILGVKNKDVSDETKAGVESALAEHGITERESVYEIIEQWEMRENPDQPQRFGHFGRFPF